MRRRSRLGLMAGAALLAAAPAWADLTVTSTMTGKSAGGEGMQTVVRIKGNKMRQDMTRGGDQTSLIFDVDAGKMITLDHKKKEAIVLDLAALTEPMQKIKSGDVAVKLTPTSETKQIAGYACTVHESETHVGPLEGTNLTINMSGPVCLSKTAPGMEEYAHFYKSAVEKGFFFGDPRAAKAQPGPAKGSAELYRKWAESGVPLSSNITTKFEGGGMVTGMMNKMVGGPTTTEVQKIDTGTIADSEFAMPAGYKVKTP